ncbi:MAG: HAMP domain-containing histidine kinase [Cyanobacteria bacterium SZAS-4]|nr:HAMP domain-containing histidine kinase [Cyanobacteria bacterium SZAS-4]
MQLAQFKPANLTIGQKGWILIAIPLGFEILITASLWFMFQQAENKAVQLSHSRDIILKLGHLSSSLLEASGSMLTFAYTSRPGLVQASRVSEDSCLKSMDILMKLAQENDRDIGEYTKLKQAVDGAIQLLRKYEQKDDNVGMLANVGALRQQLQEVHKNFKAIVQHISDIERQIELQENDADQQLKANIQALLLCFVIASVIISALLARFFSSNIASRLNKIEENSRRIGFRAELPEPLLGDDELAKLDRSLHQASDDLAAAESKKQLMIAMISHDLRSPLLSLQGTLALLLAGSCGVIPEKAQTRVQKAERSLERLIAMITDFLDLEKFSASDAVLNLQLTQTNLQKIFDESNLAVESLANDRSIEIICTGGETEFICDLNLMIRLLTNLLSNAIKFSEPNSKVEVGSGYEKDGAFITVTDHGAGIDAKSIDSLFEPFFQTKEGASKDNSSGLGLAVCREIARKHQGEITVRSKIGVGTVFRIIIPNATNLMASTSSDSATKLNISKN